MSLGSYGRRATSASRARAAGSIAATCARSASASTPVIVSRVRQHESQPLPHRMSAAWRSRTRAKKPSTFAVSSRYRDAMVGGMVAHGPYRYLLSRRWRPGAPALFVMLNPSTADDTADDPTIRRCIGFARRWGAPAVEVVNLYALRAT